MTDGALGASSSRRPRPAVLMVIDGFGVAPDSEGNAVTRAKMPVFDELTKRYPVVTLRASGETVGLMWGEMGNSEVGHLTIGAGRVYYQALPRIERAVKDKSLFENESLVEAMEHAKKGGGTLHLMGIMSSGKVHGYNSHCYAVLEMAKQMKVKKVVIHAILDGRDTLYNSGMDFLVELNQKMDEIGVGVIGSLSGRYFAMDRDNRWDRVEKAYNAIALGQSAEQFEDAIEAVKASYAKEVYDEEFVPVVMTKKGKPVGTVEAGDAMVFFNYRPDRARQITKAFCLPSFDKFSREFIPEVYMATFGEYEAGLPVHVVFPPTKIKNCLAEVLSNAGLVQLHIAETEKYAHVTFFMNGTREEPYPNEDREIIPSPKVPSYDQKPEMSAPEITEKVVSEIKTGNYDVIIMNFANPDMVGHTGDVAATIKGNETVDACVGKIVEAVLAADGVLFITADHGNGEEVSNLQTGDVDKEHSTNPVPFYIIGKQYEGHPGMAGDVPNGDLSFMPPIGILADVAPTMLKVLGIEQPPEMTGTPLI